MSLASHICQRLAQFGFLKGEVAVAAAAEEAEVVGLRAGRVDPLAAPEAGPLAAPEAEGPPAEAAEGPLAEAEELLGRLFL